MARTPVPVTTIVRTAPGGTVPPAVVNGDPVNHHTMPNTGVEWIEVDNVDGVAPHTVTFDYATVIDGQAVADRVATIPASAVGRRIGPFPVAMFGDALHFTVDDSDIKLRAFRLGR